VSAHPVTAVAAGVRIAIRVMPRSSRTGIEGVRDGRLVIRITAPPVDGAANDAAIAVLAGRLQVPRSACRITAGGTSRNKTVEISSLTAEAARQRLG
jgi:uncharacterized protein (TIGR00251 family)